MKRKLKRETNILNDFNSGMNSTNIAKKYGITRQRIYQILKIHGIGGKIHSLKREEQNKICDEVLLEIYSGVNHKESASKRNITTGKLSYLFAKTKKLSLIPNLKDKRNQIVVELFKDGNTANQIVKSKDPDLNNPTKLNNLNSVYNINRKLGTKRFPMVENRQAGSSEKIEILDLIVKLHDVDNISFSKISLKLNEMGYKTITGIPFKTENTIVKYHIRIKQKKVSL